MKRSLREEREEGGGRRRGRERREGGKEGGEDGEIDMKGRSSRVVATKGQWGEGKNIKLKEEREGDVSYFLLEVHPGSKLLQ
eukprot:768151-Hanusia_phi.AAC.1